MSYYFTEFTMSKIEKKPTKAGNKVVAEMQFAYLKIKAAMTLNIFTAMI